jgi:hypothetical protein
MTRRASALREEPLIGTRCGSARVHRARGR